MIYTLSLFGIVLTILFALYHYRPLFLRFLPASLAARIRTYAPISTFESARENGYSTANFDLSANLEQGESRTGLDERGLEEVRRIMDAMGVDFDEARLIRTNRIFKKNGIDANGFPTDPKAITSLS